MKYATVALFLGLASISAAAPAPSRTSGFMPSMPRAVLHSRSSQTAGTSNVQTFTGALGGPAPPVESSAGDRPFSVNGSTFVNAGAALQRSCAVQNNACANAVNSGALGGSVSDCNKQEQECNDAAAA